MAYGIIHFFPGGTQDQYEKSVAEVHPPSGLPEGQTFHAAGSSEGGWTIVAIHDSKEGWEKFRDETLHAPNAAGNRRRLPDASRRDQLRGSQSSAVGQRRVPRHKSDAEFAAVDENLVCRKNRAHLSRA